jgi:single-stranded-DNA-specific exonuclease
VDVIVTDHHEIVSALPEAVAILNPKIEPYPFPHLCGAAVAFKLVQALLKAGKARGVARFLPIRDGWEKWLLDLVAIATIADMVPLIGENRTLAHFGLTVLRKSPRPGIAALCNRVRLRKAEITEDDIGFSIAPRINAASRMDEPHLALSLLTTKDPQEAERLAAKLEELNASRKGVVGAIVREAKKRAAERFSAEQTVVVLGNPDWKPALLGLAANSLMGARGGVVCLWGRDALGRIKGSCRSDGALSVVELFGEVRDVVQEYGGHAASGGFSLEDGAVHVLPERLEQAAANLARKEVSRASVHEAEVSLRELSWPLFRDLSRLAPFGIGNPKPLFRTVVTITDVRAFGKEKNHVELSLHCDESGASARGYDFFRTSADFSQVPERGMKAAVIGSLERDAYRGALSLRLHDVLAL